MSSLFLFSLSIIFTLIFTAIYISISNRLSLKQVIRGEGPSGHLVKRGTPTMGGIIFIPIILIIYSFFLKSDQNLLSLIILTFAFAFIGFLDDFIKILNKRNLGLRPSHKLFLQFLFAIIWGGYLKLLNLNQSWLYLFFIAFIIVACANACNLTDGLDGLLTGCAIIAFFLYYFISLKLGNENIALLCIIASGSLLGFLFFNFNPAKIFMGDTGSLGIGALLAGISIMLHKELLLIIIGGVFVIETLSVIIQVASFKLTGRRIFKMSPLHHHFELSGFSEKRIVFGFWAVGIVLGIIGALIV